MIGAGGHAASVENCILENEMNISGLILKSINEETLLKNKYDVYVEETIHTSLDQKLTFLLNGIGMLPNCNLRDDIWKKFVHKGFRFVGLSAKSSYISPTASVSPTAQILHGSIVNCFASIGDNTIINTGVTIEHHTQIGQSCHIAPGAVVCGHCSIGDNVFIGANATISHCTQIASGTVIKAGSVVW